MWAEEIISVPEEKVREIISEATFYKKGELRLEEGDFGELPLSPEFPIIMEEYFERGLDFLRRSENTHAVVFVEGDQLYRFYIEYTGTSDSPEYIFAEYRAQNVYTLTYSMHTFDLDSDGIVELTEQECLDIVDQATIWCDHFSPFESQFPLETPTLREGKEGYCQYVFRRGEKEYEIWRDVSSYPNLKPMRFLEFVGREVTLYVEEISSFIPRAEAI